MFIEQLDILWTVVLATLLAGVVGLEREVAKKPAGFRTHMIIGGAWRDSAAGFDW